MNASNSVRLLRIPFAAALALALLAGCNKTKHGMTYGTVDYDHAITLDDVVKMGPDSAKARLVGDNRDV
jgi:hypothetical protein